MAIELTKVTFPDTNYIDLEHYTPYKGNLTDLGSGTLAAATKTYWEDNNNIPIKSVSTAYNNSGSEFTLLFSKGATNQYGTVLKYGYENPYIYALRRKNGSWLDSDWIKINAGKADQLTTAREIKLSSQFQGSANFDGSGNISIDANYYACTANGYNKANYPWHRFAYKTNITGTYQDIDAVFDLRARMYTGRHGRIKISLRTNGSNEAVNVSAVWIYRYNVAVDDVKIAYWGVTGQAVYVDVFVKCGTYPRLTIYEVEGERSWTLLNSNEVSNTTTTDKLTSTEVYSSIESAATEIHNQAYTNIVAAYDAGFVSEASKASKDGSGNIITSTYVNKTGDTMTGDLTLYMEGTTTNNYPTSLIFQNKNTTTGKTSNAAIYAYDGGENGANLVIHPTGNIFIGSGESANAHYNLYKHSTAEMFFATADQHMYLQANGQTIANRRGLIINASHELLPCAADVATNNIGSIGNATYKWGSMYTTRFNQIITGSGTAAQDKGKNVSPRYFPAKWTFNTGLTAADGDIFTIKIPVAGHDYGVFMSVDNGTTYYPIVCNGTGRLTTHYPVNTYMTVIYESTGSCVDIFPLNGGDARTTVSNGVWRVLNYYDTNSNTIPSAYCDTAAATANKTASCTNYSALSKSYLHVLIRYANTSKTALTLNVNSQGAKAIYINGSASSTTNYTLPAGTYLVYYNGTNYYFRTDGKLTADITGTATDASNLAQNTRMDYGWSGVNYFNINGTAGTGVKVNDTPTTTWWHIMRFNHANNTGYYTDLAIPFNANSLYYKRINNGALQNDGWVKVYDELNLKSETAASSGTTLSLVTTGEKAIWNAKGSGTITSIKTTAGAHTTINVSSGAANFNVPTKTSHLTNDSGFVTSDTKNTAGSTDTSSKIFLIGATSQTTNPQTYSDNEVYTTSGVLTTKSVQVGGGSATMQYNSTTASIDFIFT